MQQFEKDLNASIRKDFIESGRKRLDISHQNVNNLSKTIGTLKSLQSLYLDSNTISLLPDSIGQLKNLLTLFIHQNHLQTLPDALGNLKQLQALNLETNYLTILPSTFGSLHSLIACTLENNQLCTLPAEIGQLSKLVYLDLTKNQLESLPKTISNLKNLKFLNLAWNRLVLSKDIIAALEKLQAQGCFIEGIEYQNTKLRNPLTIRQIIGRMDLSGQNDECEEIDPDDKQLPQAVINAYAFYYEIYAEPDLGSVTIFLFPYDRCRFYIIHTTTDGDDTYTEVYDERGNSVATGMSMSGNSGCITWDQTIGKVRDYVLNQISFQYNEMRRKLTTR